MIDHIMVSKRWRSSISSCRTYRGAELGNADHRLVVAKACLKLKAQSTSPASPRFNSKLLKDPLIREQFAVEISNRFTLLADMEVTDVEHQWAALSSSVRETSSHLLTRRTTAKKPWISQNSLQIIEQCRTARVEQNMTEYRRLDKLRKKALADDQDNYWEEKAKTLEDASSRNDYGTLFREYRLLSPASRPTNHISTVKDKHGNCLTSKDDCLGRWKEHFETLLNKPPAPPNHEAQVAADDAEPLPCDTAPVTPDEVRKALGRLKTGRAAGICNITVEMLLAGGETMVKWLTVIINCVWVEEKLPDDWRRGIILPFWKHKGDRLECSNHRGITLLSIPGKLFACILLNRSLPAVRGNRRKEQAGFMPGQSTINQIFALRQIIEKAIEFQQPLYIAFIDFKAAFDSVDRNTLWLLLQASGLPPKLTRLFSLLYHDSVSCVRIQQDISDWFSIASGVRQGCVVAPDLFNCVIDQLMRRTIAELDGNIGINLGPWSLTDLDYADDIALFATSTENLQQILNTVNTEGAKLGLRISWPKTKVMAISVNPIPLPPPLLLDNETVEFVENFTYLGSSVAANGAINHELSTRIAKAAGAMRKLQQRLWHRRSISLKTKLRMYNTLVLSVLLYGCETWQLRTQDSKRIDVFDNQCLRSILGIRWFHHITNEAVRCRTQQHPASVLAAQRRLRWFGHVSRMEAGHPAKDILDFNPRIVGWRRPRGRPRHRWMDTVSSNLQLTSTPMFRARRLVLDRDRWRSVCRSVTATLDPRHAD
jgi:hypothetical protein